MQGHAKDVGRLETPAKEQGRMKRRGRGEGTIFEVSPGHWVASLTLGYKIVDGKRVRIRKKFTGSTRNEAHHKLAKALGRQMHGQSVSTKTHRLGEFLRTWLDTVAKPSVRPKTFRTYSDIVKLHIAPALATMAVETLTPELVQGFLTDKLGSGLCPHCKLSLRADRWKNHIAQIHPDKKTVAFRPLGPATIKHIRDTLRCALAVAMEWYHLDRNVAAIAKPPRAERKEMRSLTSLEAHRYLEAATEDRLVTLFTVTVALGLRQAEILGLKWGDIDFESGTLEVRRQLQRIEGKLQLMETKSEEGVRRLVLPTVVITSLNRHRGRQNEERAVAGDQWHESDLLFTTTIGTPIDARHVIRRHHAIVKAAKIPHLRFHDLRHSAATLLLAQGVSPKYISQLLGHKQVAFTMQTYAHVKPESQRQVADMMDSILVPLPKPKPVAPSLAPLEVLRKVN
jgi:integrase